MGSAADKSPDLWLGYPTPRNSSTIPTISPIEVHELLMSGETSFQLIDVRRTDADNYLIKSSINLPAHTFYPTRAAIARLLQTHASATGGTVTAIVYCQSCSETGRGRRCAGWLRDVLQETGTQANVEVKVLDGGIKAFISQYANDSEVMVKLPQELKES